MKGSAKRDLPAVQPQMTADSINQQMVFETLLIGRLQ
jgi:hypothetical protein